MLIGNGEAPREQNKQNVSDEQKPVDYWMCLVFFMFLCLCFLGIKEIVDILLKYDLWW